MKEMNSGLISHIDSLNQEMKALREENRALHARIAELESKLNKNSKNSNKPPSTDNYKKPSNSREKTGRASGGQQGHEGKTLLKVDNPNEIIHIKPETCRCGCNLNDSEGKTKTRQVFELPAISITVTEYRTHEVSCPLCNRIHKTEFPEKITQPVQYGDNLQALMVYLSYIFKLPAVATFKDIRNYTYSYRPKC